MGSNFSSQYYQSFLKMFLFPNFKLIQEFDIGNLTVAHTITDTDEHFVLKNLGGGRILTSCYDDEAPKIWNTNTGTLIRQLDFPAHWFHPLPENILAAYNEDQSYLVVWDLTSYKSKREHLESCEWADFVKLRNGLFAASEHMFSPPRQYNLLFLKLVGLRFTVVKMIPNAHDYSISDLVELPNEQVATGTREEIKIWSYIDLSLIRVIEKQNYMVQCMHLLDGNKLLSRDLDTFCVWNHETGELEREFLCVEDPYGFEMLSSNLMSSEFTEEDDGNCFIRVQEVRNPDPLQDIHVTN